MIQAAKLSPSMKDGIVGLTSAQASERPQTMPVPRGPKSHLWQPETRKSQPRSGGCSGSTPKPCTASTQRSVLPLPSSASRSARASAIARIGSFTPVLECTQVTATAFV